MQEVCLVQIFAHVGWGMPAGVQMRFPWLTRVSVASMPACSGKRLTLVINPQWQTQGQVISGGWAPASLAVVMAAGKCMLLEAPAYQAHQLHSRPNPFLCAMCAPIAPSFPSCCRLWHWAGSEERRALCVGL
jgi:hypothetical protein